MRTLDKVATPNPDWNGAEPDPGTSAAPYRLYNIGNNQPVELMYFIECIEKAVGKKAHQEHAAAAARRRADARLPTSMRWWPISDFSRRRRSRRAFSASSTGIRNFIAPREPLDGDFAPGRRSITQDASVTSTSAASNKLPARVADAARRPEVAVCRDGRLVLRFAPARTRHCRAQAGYDVAVATRVDRHGERITDAGLALLSGGLQPRRAQSAGRVAHADRSCPDLSPARLPISFITWRSSRCIYGSLRGADDGDQRDRQRARRVRLRVFVGRPAREDHALARKARAQIRAWAAAIAA